MPRSRHCWHHFLVCAVQGGRLVILNRISLGEFVAFYSFMVQLIFR